MSEKRCPCGGVPYKHPPHLEAKRKAMWAKSVEWGRRRPDEEMPALCAVCLWRRLTDGLDAKHDVNATGGSA